MKNKQETSICHLLCNLLLQFSVYSPADYLCLGKVLFLYRWLNAVYKSLDYTNAPDLIQNCRCHFICMLMIYYLKKGWNCCVWELVSARRYSLSLWAASWRLFVTKTAPCLTQNCRCLFICLFREYCKKTFTFIYIWLKKVYFITWSEGILLISHSAPHFVGNLLSVKWFEFKVQTSMC